MAHAQMNAPAARRRPRSAIACAVCRTAGNVYRYCMRRFAEVMLTAAMCGVATVLIFSPQSLRLNSFRLMIDWGFTSQIIIAFFVVGAALRVSAFIANGNWPKYGPLLRAFGALIGASMWAQFALGLWQFSQGQNGAISTGVPVYSVLALGELFLIHRAARDGKAPQ